MAESPNLLQLLLESTVLTRDDLIAVYYHAGYRITEIIGFLAYRHHIAISARQVHRILRRMGLSRRDRQSSLVDIVRAIIQELHGTSPNVGYRQMRRILLVDYGLIASCELVRLALTVVDPEGVAARQRRCLQRRQYVNLGPNFAIHIDGWDKLKPFGISVHGAIDGFSRRILWLEACDSNKNPKYVARYYLDYIKEMNGVPMIIYADRGTENVIVRDIQYALRWNHQDDFQGSSSFIYGSSNRNTRIERFWRNLRQMCGDAWMNHFKSMANLGLLDTSDRVHLECIRFCFIKLLNKDLVRVKRFWNQHTMRRNNAIDFPGGKPDVLYFQPERYTARDYKMPLPGDPTMIEDEYGQYPPANCVSLEFEVVATEIIRINQLQSVCTSIDQATELFVQIIHHIDNL